VRSEIFSVFSASPTVVSQELCRIAFGELKVPYGHAVLTLFDKLNAGDTPGVIFCGRKSSKLLSIPSTTLIDKKNAICALTALAGQSPASQSAKDASPALQSLVDRARRARFDERAQFARPAAAAPNASYAPLLWQFATARVKPLAEMPDIRASRTAACRSSRRGCGTPSRRSRCAR
jgi:hypothetical protein